MTSTVLQRPAGSGLLDRSVAPALALAAAANGGFMLADPLNWYRIVPGVVDTGPANAHFIRDIGIAFCVVAAALTWGALRPAAAAGLYCMAALFLGLHAGLHFVEYLHHGVPMHSLASDLAGIALPAVLSLLLAVRAAIRSKEISQ